jgi:segregation and condensation protein B
VRDDVPTPKQILEALLFAADEPLSARRLAVMIEDASPGLVADLVRELDADYLRESRAFHVTEIAGGYRLVTRPEFAGWVAELRASGAAPRLSQAALETLSIVAYCGPSSRPEIARIRGVAADSAVEGLVERGLLTEAGRDGNGGAMRYRTTPLFERVFGLASLAELPALDDLGVDATELRERLEAVAGRRGA